MRISDLSAGVILGNRYRFIDILGRGGFGDVWRVENLYDKAKPPEIALKIYHDQEKGNRILFQEARQSKVFIHPRLVQVFDADRVDGIFCMEMEYVPGLTMAQRMGEPERPNYVNLDEAYRWMIDVAEGLSYLHSLNPPVSHGDVKPDNLIITSDGVKLMDFGHSRTIEEQFVITNGMGAWFYTAPEILGQSYNEPGKRYISSDIYAFGVVFYRVLTGRFPRTSLSEIISVVPFPRPCDLNSAIPPELDEIIIKCLEKYPEDRFTNANNLVIALQAAKSKQHKATLKVIQPLGTLAPQPEMKDAYEYIDKAQKLASLKDYSGAISALDNAISRISTNTTVLFLYAHVAKQAGRLDVAKKAYQQLILWMENEDIPNNKRIEAYEGLGEVSIKLKDYERAVNCFEYLMKHGQSSWYSFRYGVALGLAARYKDSVRVLEKVYKEQPGNATVCAKIGFAYLQEGNRRLAIQYFNEALMFDEYEPTALYYMAIIRYLDGFQGKAMQYLERLRNSNNDSVKIKQLENHLGIGI